MKEFFILLLILETALIGVFTALDLFLFYFFWESTLIPMALLIGMYGHGRKVYAAVKFFLYTMVASVFMLAAMLWLYAKVGKLRFRSRSRMPFVSGQVDGFASCGAVVVPGILRCVCGEGAALPRSIPGCRTRTSRRPPPGSVLLAGVLLKMGTYGMLRFNLGLFSRAVADRMRHWVMVRWR